MRTLFIATSLATALLSGSVSANNLFCGGPVPQTGEPTDLAHVVGDQTLEYMADQPASMMVCSKGYLFEKCGDHATAMRIFDRCIEAGYIGAMIWKALMLQDGALGEPDLPGAAALMRRAAEAGDSPYATLGKLHYASALQEGKGVARDVAAARQWFEAAAADGNPDAIEFLRTGYHVGDRDGTARGVGVAPAPVAVAAPLPGELFDEAGPARAVPASPPGRPASARHLLAAAPATRPALALPVPSLASPPAALPEARPVRVAQRLVPLPVSGSAAPPGATPLAGLIVLLVLAGALRQGCARPPSFSTLRT